MTNSPRTVKTAVVLTLALAAVAPAAASARPADDELVRTAAPIHRVIAPKPPTAIPMSAAVVAHRSNGPFVRTVAATHRATAPVESAPAAQAPATGFDWTLDGLLAGGALLLSMLGGLWLRHRRPGPRGTATLAG
ncbi:MAG: hypothetical protein JWQ18_1809 [Conexibacter sp.]|nr:hypothetical protein [Conexibacter sp.]